MELKNKNKHAMILLHEIYGINSFICEISKNIHAKGFDVFCPDMLDGKSYEYAEAAEAYENFIEKVGFGYFMKVEELLSKLRTEYEKVFVLGFSVGATIAWRCCENGLSAGIICVYGSRIRDYKSIVPSCPTLLLFANQDSFPVEALKKELEGTEREVLSGTVG